MNDSTNYSYLEASAKRKKRNQFISILIIVAVVLAVVVGWGIRELKKAQDAERIKNALSSQVEPAFPVPSENSAPSSVVDSSAMEVSDSPDVRSPLAEVPKEEPLPEIPAPETIPPQVEKPVVTPKPKSTVAKSETKARPPEFKPAVEKPEPKLLELQEKEAKEKAAAAEKAALNSEAPVVIAKVEPAVPKTPATPPPAPATPTPAPTPVTPAKAFAPEDMPMPTKVEPSEEGLAAVASIPKAEPVAGNAPATASEHFKTGLEAYKQADYVNAIRAFAALPKPASRKRGEPERDEYVQGNFLRGVALLKMQHISEAATAFQNSLEYEKYYPLANMNLGICYIELKQYAKAHKCFESVIRDQSFIEPAMFDDVMQRTKYFWALAWTRLYKGSKDPDRQNYYRQQAILRWKDYQVWFGKNDKFKSENQKADNYLKSLAAT